MISAIPAPAILPSALPLIVLFGATASGKTALSLALAERFGGEVLSCDSVAVYRHMELGTAKPSTQARASIPHHLLDLYNPTEACTAGDYARHARHALHDLASRNRLPVLVGGTGLYLRALLDGLFAAPPRNEALREMLRARAERRGPASLYRALKRLDPAAAALIHANDISKVIRAIEVSLSASQPMTDQWRQGRDALAGYNVIRLGLNPPTPELYERINRRAEGMFEAGLVEETRQLVGMFGQDCRPFTSLGYLQAMGVLNGKLPLAAAIAAAQQGHRNYAKRQKTWFRREAELHTVQWLHDEAIRLVQEHLKVTQLTAVERPSHLPT
jgi:tRNA dimethylallyltransferase